MDKRVSYGAMRPGFNTLMKPDGTRVVSDMWELDWGCVFGGNYWRSLSFFLLSFHTYLKYQIVWTTSQASRDATSNSLEQFQLVDSTFAPVLYWILGLKCKHVGLKVIFFIGSIKLLDVPRYQIVWTTSQASRDATSNYLEQFQLVDSKFKLFAPVMYL